MNKKDFLERSIELEKAKLIKMQKKVRQSQEAIPYMAREIERYRQQGSSERVMSRMLQEIQEVAGDIDIQVADLKPQRMRIENGMSVFSVSLRLNVEFIDLMELLYNLRQEPYEFGLQDLKIDKGVSRRGSQLSVSIVLRKVYVVGKI